MKAKLLLLLALAAGLLSGCNHIARWTHRSAAPAPPAAATLVAPADRDAAWLAQAWAAYPLKTCLVSGEELGGMGGAIDMIYRQPGSPDRLLRFCCDGCPDDFKKDPARYLALLDHPAGGVPVTPTKHDH